MSCLASVVTVMVQVKHFNNILLLFSLYSAFSFFLFICSDDLITLMSVCYCIYVPFYITVVWQIYLHTYHYCRNFTRYFISVFRMISSSSSSNDRWSSSSNGNCSSINHDRPLSLLLKTIMILAGNLVPNHCFPPALDLC